MTTRCSTTYTVRRRGTADLLLNRVNACPRPDRAPPVPPDPSLACRGQAAVPVLAHQHQEEAFQCGQPAGSSTQAAAKSAVGSTSE
jgi:hypothetical protein